MPSFNPRFATGGGVKSVANKQVICLGTVFIAPIVPEKGIIKERHCVVVEEPSLILADPLVVVGITSSGGTYDPKNTSKFPATDFFAMPFGGEGPSAAFFTKPCAAFIEFYQDVKRGDVKQIFGPLQPDEVDALIRWLENG